MAIPNIPYYKIIRINSRLTFTKSYPSNYHFNNMHILKFLLKYKYKFVFHT